MPSLPPDEILRLLFSGKDEFDSETNLALTAKQFEEVVERVSARERMHQVSTAPLLRFLKANARHWSTLSGFREARAQLYRQVALAAVSSRALAQQKVSAAKLLLHLTSNSSPSELQSQFTFAFDQILACLGLQPFSPTKATLFHLKVLRVIIERGNTLSQTQVTKAAGTIARIALSSNATTTPSAPPSRSTNQTADNPFLSKELKHCRVKSKGYITSDSEDDDGAQRKTIDHQVKHLALVCVESLTRTFPRLFRTAWSTFLASEPKACSSDLLHLTTTHAALDIRIQALKCAQAIFQDHEFLQVAQESEKPYTRGFKSLSETLASIIRLTLARLTRSLSVNATSVSNDLLIEQLHAQQCLSQLAMHAPWPRLRPDLPRLLWSTCRTMYVQEQGPSDQRGLVVSTLTSLYPNLPWNDKPAESRVVFEVFLSREQSLVTSEEWNLVGMMALHLSRDEQTKVIGLASQAVSEFKSISSAAIKGLLPLSVSEHSEVTHAEIDHLLSQVVTGSDEALLQAVVGYLQYPSCLTPETYMEIQRTTLGAGGQVELQAWASLGTMLTQADVDLNRRVLQHTSECCVNAAQKLESASAVPFSWTLSNLWDYLVKTEYQALEDTTLLKLSNATLTFDERHGNTAKVQANLGRIYGALHQWRSAPSAIHEKAQSRFITFLSPERPVKVRSAAASRLGDVVSQRAKITETSRTQFLDIFIFILTDAPFTILSHALLSPGIGNIAQGFSSQADLQAAICLCKKRIDTLAPTIPFSAAQRIPSMLDVLQNMRSGFSGASL